MDCDYAKYVKTKYSFVVKSSILNKCVNVILGHWYNSLQVCNFCRLLFLFYHTMIHVS